MEENIKQENENINQEDSLNKEQVLSYENKKEDHKDENKKEYNSIFMGILAYLSFLVIIPFLVAKDNPFVKFHIKQGLVILSLQIVFSIVFKIIWVFWPIMHILNLGLLVLSVLGIINVVHKKEKELPIIGSLVKHFKF